MRTAPGDPAEWETRRCWRLTILPAGQGGGIGDDLRWGHFADGDDAVAAALECLPPPGSRATLLSANAATNSGVTAEPGHCIAVVCGRCRQSLGDEDEDIHELHFDSIPDARDAALEAGWWALASGPSPGLLCPKCRDVSPIADDAAQRGVVEGWSRPRDLRGPGPCQLPLAGMSGARSGRGDRP